MGPQLALRPAHQHLMMLQILLVAMNGHLRDALADWFHLSVPDCRVRHASGPREAIDLCRRHPPDLVVTQDRGGNIPCIDLIRAIIDAAISAPIVVLTNTEYPPHGERLIAAGAAACVRPWRINVDLLGILEQLNVAHPS